MPANLKVMIVLEGHVRDRVRSSFQAKASSRSSPPPTAFVTDSGRSALAAGTRPHAPNRTLIAAAVGRLGRVFALYDRRLTNAHKHVQPGG